MPEMWAFCGPCARWYYIPFSTGEEMARTACPVCASYAQRFEVRTGAAAFDVAVVDNDAVEQATA